MEKKFNFTQERIRELPIPETGRVDYFDTGVPKLTCRVSSTGNKSFVVLKWDGKAMKRITLDKFPTISVKEAQDQAKTVLASISQGNDPIEQKRKKKKAQKTLIQVLEDYIDTRSSDQKGLKPRTIRDYRYKINHDLADWKDMPVSKITEKMVVAKHKELSKIGSTMANAAMRVLRLTLNHAQYREKIIESNPVNPSNMLKVWNTNERRKRIIARKQMAAWYAAVESLPNEKAKVYLLMLLYMGFRSNEALTLEWSSVDLNAENITVYDTKNGTDHTLPIPTALLPYIKQLKVTTGACKWVFTGVDPEKHMTVPKKQIAAVIKASGVEFSSHDCRRTFATIAEAVHLSTTIIKRLLNHTASDDVTDGYIITEEETLRSAVNKIGIFIMATATQKDNVITLQANKA